MHKLFYTTRSFTCESTALIIRIALEELNLPYDIEEVELSPEPPKWYLELNRHGQIPTLEFKCDNAEQPISIAPSPAILLALSDADPNNLLLPADMKGRAECYAQLFDMVEMLHTCFMRHFTPSRYTTSETEKAYSEISEKACMRISAYFSNMDELLKHRNFIAGDQYSMCDIYFYIMSRWYLDISPSEGLVSFLTYKNIFSYCRRIESREAVQRSLAQDSIEPIASD